MGFITDDDRKVAQSSAKSDLESNATLLLETQNILAEHYKKLAQRIMSEARELVRKGETAHRIYVETDRLEFIEAPYGELAMQAHMLNPDKLVETLDNAFDMKCMRDYQIERFDIRVHAEQATLILLVIFTPGLS